MIELIKNVLLSKFKERYNEFEKIPRYRLIKNIIFSRTVIWNILRLSYLGLILFLLNFVIDPDSSFVNAFLIFVINVLYLVTLVFNITSQFNVILPKKVTNNLNYKG